MTREELEKVLADSGWKKSYHGTHSALWQKEDRIIEVSDKGVDIGLLFPWLMVSLEGSKLVIHREIEL